MTTDLFGTPPATLDSITTPKHRGRRAGTLGIVATAAIALFVGGMGATASADPGDPSGGPSLGEPLATVQVGQGILMTDLNDVTLTGASGQLVVNTDPETFNVKTNATTGYTVTVNAAASTLVKGADSIPIGYLQVSGDVTPQADHSAYVPFVAAVLPADPTAPLTVHAQHTPSGIDGDNLTNNYRMDIPGVPQGSYTVTLDYIAAVQ